MTSTRNRRSTTPSRRRGSAHPLESRGWTSTRAGRWIDPVTGRSYTTLEAWDVLAARPTYEACADGN